MKLGILKLLGERVIKERARPAFDLNELNQTIIPENTKVRANEIHVGLPKTDLSIFLGLYEEWPSFFNTFNFLIHSNTSLNDIQKFHYLKSSIKERSC